MKAEHFNKLLHIQELLWKDDDLMDQMTLFELQDKVANFLLEAATPAQQAKLANRFPWLYERRKG